jgi:primosomal protein N'
MSKMSWEEYQGDFYTPPPFKVCPECEGAGIIPIYYTVEQWEKLTGRKVPDDISVLWRWKDNVHWSPAFLSDIIDDIKRGYIDVVIATEAGRPPKEWRPT